MSIRGREEWNGEGVCKPIAKSLPRGGYAWSQVPSGKVGNKRGGGYSGDQYTRDINLFLKCNYFSKMLSKMQTDVINLFLIFYSATYL